MHYYTLLSYLYLLQLPLKGIHTYIHNNTTNDSDDKVYLNVIISDNVTMQIIYLPSLSHFYYY